MFDRDRGVKCNGTGITGSGDFIRFKGLYAERRKAALQAILGAGTSEVVKELLTLVLRKG